MSVLSTLFMMTTAAHAVPAQFTHQGRLLDGDETPLEGDISITFRVTAAESGGDSLWEETLTVSTSSGFYAAVLGADEESNPLDSEVFSHAPVWLELQIDGEPAMYPRTPIQSVPYANMAQVAEEVHGGPVDASEVSVEGLPVINESGEWVGPTPAISWDDIDGIPSGFIDGVDEDTDSLAILSTSCIDGDVPVWDSIIGEWVCDIDQDTLASIGCLNGQIIHWSSEDSAWVCTEDEDTVLSEGDVDIMVENNGYAMTDDVFSGSFNDLADVPAGLSDGDDDTVRSDDEIVAAATGAAIDLHPGTTIGGSAIPTADEAAAAGVPAGVIVMWSGTTPPDGWAICNGDSGTPDLRDRFVVSSGSSRSPGDYGESSVSVGAGSNVFVVGYPHGSSWSTSIGYVTSISNPTPRYYALAYIMKL